MITQGWTRITKLIASIAIAATLSGCHSVQVGAPHPFTTMFDKQPPRPQDQVVRAQYLFDTDLPTKQQTASGAADAVH